MFSFLILIVITHLVSSDLTLFPKTNFEEEINDNQDRLHLFPSKVSIWFYKMF
jgi:hypothetical protein